jgi:hypothetical protein
MPPSSDLSAPDTSSLAEVDVCCSSCREAPADVWIGEEERPLCSPCAELDDDVEGGLSPEEIAEAEEIGVFVDRPVREADARAVLNTMYHEWRHARFQVRADAREWLHRVRRGARPRGAGRPRVRRVARSCSRSSDSGSDPDLPPPADLDAARRRRERAEVQAADRCAICGSSGSVFVRAWLDFALVVRCGTCGCECIVHRGKCP